MLTNPHTHLIQQDVFKTHAARMLQHLVLLVTPIEFTHEARVYACVPFVNTGFFLSGLTSILRFGA